MAQAFITTTKNSYRWIVQEKTRPIKQWKLYEGCFGKNVDWFTEEELCETLEHIDKLKAAVKELQIKRMSSTTYREDYCKERKKIVVDQEGTEDTFQNQLVEKFTKLYEEKTGKILPTIESQRIFGFLPPSRMRTPTTTYIDDYGRVGFDRLMNNVTK